MSVVPNPESTTRATLAPVPERVLIVRLGAIGDVVNALALASALKRASPRVQIGWAVHELALPLVDGHPAVERVHLWRRGGGWSGFRDFRAELRAQHYELAIDLQRILKSAFVARTSGAPRVLGFDRARCKELAWLFYSERIPPAPAGAAPTHMLERYLEFARALGLPTQPPLRELPANAAADERARELCAGLTRPLVLIGLGASKPANRWPAARFGALAQRLVRKAQVEVAFSGGPQDRALAEQALAAAGDARVLDLVGRASLLEFAACARRARLFIGCDTGPMHIAAAVGTRVLALFGPADPRRTGPYPLELHRVLRDPPFPPASPHSAHTPHAPHARTGDLSLEHVSAAAFELLAELAREQPSR